MKIIILGIIAFLSLLLVRVKEGLGFTDGNINTASFDATGTIPGYKDAGTRQWGAKMANNAAVAYRWSGRAMVIDDQEIPAASEKIYDAARDYRDAYLFIQVQSETYSGADLGGSIPYYTSYVGGQQFFWDFESILQISTTEQGMLSASGGYLHIRANGSTGFIIRNSQAADSYWFTAIITELKGKVAE